MDRLLILDVDGTLTKIKSIWQYLLESVDKWEGKGEANLAQYLNGEIDYYKFCQLDAQLLKGIPFSQLRDTAYCVPMYDGIDKVFCQAKKSGYAVALVSTGLRLLTDYFEHRYNVSFCFANNLGFHRGLCDGTAIVDVEEGQKSRPMKQIIQSLNPSHVVAAGDSLGDVGIFEHADTRIAVNSKSPELIQMADLHIQGDSIAQLADVLYFLHRTSRET